MKIISHEFKAVFSFFGQRVLSQECKINKDGVLYSL